MRNHRKDVYCIGKFCPRAIKREIEQRNLNFYILDTKDIDNRCHNARAFLFLIPSKDVDGSDTRKAVAKFRAYMPRILKFGAAFLFITENGQANASTLEQLSDELEEDKRLLAHQRSRINFKVLHLNEPWVIAQHCADHDPGRIFNKVTHLESDHFQDRSLESPILITRAFSDFKDLKVDKLKVVGGRATVWRVDAKSDGKSSVPFVVKIGRINEIENEMDAQQGDCVNYIPFPYRAPIVLDRCVVGYSMRALVTFFVDRAEHLDSPDTCSPEIIDALFDGPLKLCRQGQDNREGNLGEIYKASCIFPSDPERYKKAYSRLDDKRDVLEPPQLLGAIELLGSTKFTQCIGHGDLHIGNIFVRNKRDIVLIDFNKAGEIPAARDPATLDTSLAFDFPNGPAEISDEAACKLYEVPLLEMKHFETKHPRLAAIMGLRKHVKSLCSEREYQISIAALLLWQAGSRKKPTAYKLANKIIRNLQR